MAFLEAYCDESGTHASADYLVVTGFLGHAQDWVQFDRQWKAALRDQGIPFFKAQWFAKRKRFFADWGDDAPRRKGFMGRLLTAIRDANVVPISVAMRMADYNHFVPPGEIRNRLGSAYTLCAEQIMLMCGNWSRGNGFADPIKYVFDAGHANRHEFEEAHRNVYQNSVERDQFLVGSLTFGDEQEIPPLQAADLLAYECIQNLGGKTKRHPMHEILKLDFQAWMFSPDQLSDMASKNFRNRR